MLTKTRALVVIVCLMGSLSNFLALSASAVDTSSLSAGQSLAAGQEMLSQNSLFRAVMQGDGNFVVYGAGGGAIWQSGSGGTGDGGFAAMQADGNFVVYSAEGRPLFSTSTAPSSNSRLVFKY